MKIFYLSIFLSLSSPIFSITSNPAAAFHKQADAWAHDAVSQLDSKNILALLELTYISYQRSYMTLVTQPEYMALFERIGSGWNHLISTRLNPSLDQDFDATTVACDNKLLQQLALFQKDCALQQHYVDATEKIVTDVAHEYIQSKVFVDDLRTRARTVVAESLSVIITQIEQEVEKAYHTLNEAAEHFKNSSKFKKISLAEFEPETKFVSELLWHYVPSLMVKAFVNFDAGYSASSKACLQAYLESQQVSNKLWHAIELPRAAYYAAHYQALYALAKQYYPELIVNFESPEFFVQQLIIYNAQS